MTSEGKTESNLLGTNALIENRGSPSKNTVKKSILEEQYKIIGAIAKRNSETEETEIDPTLKSQVLKVQHKKSGEMFALKLYNKTKQSLRGLKDIYEEIEVMQTLTCNKYCVQL